MQIKHIILIGIGVCLGVTKLKAQSCCGSPGLLSGGDNVFNFTTLCKKKVVADLNVDYTHFSHAAHASTQDTATSHNHNHNHNHTSSTQNAAEHQNMLESVTLTTAQVRYGLHDKLTLHAQVPLWFVSASEKHTTILGDVSVLATYRVIEKEHYGIGLNAGLELPTGSNYVVFENNYLTTGTGSFDPMAGASFWFKYKRFITRVQTQYKQGMKGFDDIRFGSSCNTQWVIAYYVKGAAEDSPLKINLNTGLNQDWTDAHSLNKKLLDNTGSFILWYHAGMQLRYKKFIFPLSFNVPVYTQLRGMQNKPEFRVRTGLTLLF